MSLIRESEIKDRLNELLNQVWTAAESELASPATGIGLHLYGHGGDVTILLNSDDDESFQAEAIEHFVSKQWGTITIPELEAWVAEGTELKFEKEDGTHVSEMEAYQATFGSLVDATKGYISNLAAGKWRPNYFVFEDSPVLMGGGFWDCPHGISLPPQPDISSEPLATNGFRAGTPNGLKVYSIGNTERKYCALYLGRGDPPLPQRVGTPVLQNWPDKVEAHAWAKRKRKGILAHVDRTSFAIKREANEEFRDWLKPHVEFLPLQDEDGQSWEIVHVLGGTTISSKQSRRGRGMPALEHTRNEWLHYGHPILRGSDGRQEQILVLVDANDFETDFFDLANRHGIRGVQFNLIWCEDTAFLKERLQAAVEQIRDKAEKYTGSRELTGPYSEAWSERDYDLHQLGQDIQDHRELKGMEGYLTVNLRHFYNA